MQRFFVVMYRYLFESGTIYDVVEWGNCKELMQLAVLDKDTMGCYWVGYQDKPQISEDLLKLDVFEGLGVSYKRKSRSKFSVQLHGCDMAIYRSGYYLYLDNIGDKFLLYSDSMLRNAELSIALVCDSGEGVYRIMFYLSGPAISLYLNLWVDSVDMLPLCVSWGLNGIEEFSKVFQQADLKKVSRLRGRIAKGALLGGRIY